MRTVERKYLNLLNDDDLVVMTVQSISSYEKMNIADFRDQEGLKFTKSNNWIGMGKDSSLRFGKDPICLRNGIWLCKLDSAAIEKYKNMKLEPSLLKFGILSI